VNYSSSITGLSLQSVYYVRAYATNTVGTGYSEEITFTTDYIDTGSSFIPGTFTDTRDGHLYKTVQIGAQTWMAENLDYRTSDSSWYYNNDSVAYHIYGRLYTWNTAMSVAPSGWHLPSDREWTTLTSYLGGDAAGDKLKEAGNVHWWYDNNSARNVSGFTALPGGIRGFNYMAVNQYGYWWSSTVTGSPWCRIMSSYYASVQRYTSNELYGISVRCVKD
jgi:uncharacterized protein (TIGR02145 family)